jgi:hypothetical protein
MVFPLSCTFGTARDIAPGEQFAWLYATEIHELAQRRRIQHRRGTQNDLSASSSIGVSHVVL